MDKTAEVFDWSQYEDVDTAEVRIRDPEGNATPLHITIAGPEHPARKRITHARQRRLRMMLAKTGKLPQTDPEEDEADALDMLVACTLAWRGAPVPFSLDECRKLYTDKRRQYIVRQVREAFENLDLFTRRSAAN